tara:strand:+ start:242 stop:826 length:585 start_codon:yes stop_codon:yes gene_type:complete
MLQHFTKNKITAGCDEAGRGCLAGPVVAASVILPKNFNNKILNDSKLLSEKKRYLLREIIEEEAHSFSIGIVSPKKIDEINILNASLLAMHKAIDKLKRQPDLLIIDGNKFKQYRNIKHICIIKGDKKYFSIAAASVLAKTYRDDIMKKLNIKIPCYNWKNNKGYPTNEHRLAIKNNGISIYHRKSFQLLNYKI